MGYAQQQLILLTAKIEHQNFLSLNTRMFYPKLRNHSWNWLPACYRSPAKFTQKSTCAGVFFNKVGDF